MGPSDGISKEDWDVVHGLAVDVANASMRDDDEATGASRRHLLEYLDFLQEKYGPLPSILATRASYSDDRTEKLDLLTRAYALADARRDHRSQLYVASSLAELHIEEFRDASEGLRWLRLVRGLLEEVGDSSDVREYERLRRTAEDP